MVFFTGSRKVDLESRQCRGFKAPQSPTTFKVGLVGNFIPEVPGGEIAASRQPLLRLD